MRTKLLLGTAAVAVMVNASAIAQTGREPRADRSAQTHQTSRANLKSPGSRDPVPDAIPQSAEPRNEAAGTASAAPLQPAPSNQAAQGRTQQNAEPASQNVRTVYPNQIGPQRPVNQPTAEQNR